MKSRGFTLVEILIVVVILGILAAIVIPQFTDAASQANESALMSNLQAVRGQIELYKIQHKENLPGEDSSAGLKGALTTQTDIDGAAGTDYGPYMREIPKNPYNKLNTVKEAATDPGAADNTTGWYFNTANGDFRANSNDDPNHWSW